MYLPQLHHSGLYASFDRFPSSKGAGTHIGRAAQTLFSATGGGLLCVLGSPELPPYQNENPIEIFRFNENISNFLERTIAFGAMVDALVENQKSSLKICHFRDPWSGTPLLLRKDRRYATVYEINGLPSIELITMYPRAGAGVLAKIRELESNCWTRADAVIAPSHTMKENLVALGVPNKKITVIHNGADVLEAPERPADAPERYLLYFGAMQPWQGVDVLLRAFALLADHEDLVLVICCSNRPRQVREYARLSRRLGTAGRVKWLFQLPHGELRPWVAHALVSLAPLTECSRNLQQGCCPLKVLESMAAGVPVIASDIPSVREFVVDNVNGRLVRPGRPSELARAIRVLLEYPDEIRRLGNNGRELIQSQFTWDHSSAKLSRLYEDLVPCNASLLTIENAENTEFSLNSRRETS